ncbi:MAG: low molecular weight phosphotyrosine protein phosphatase [Fimbriimonadia bacterium]|nr:low molecular weight phosphotyrosine protein phosphatase [Fimbriimonadia bacterium]
MNENPTPIRVLFVCLGNICRSPMAEGIFRKLVEEQGVENHFDIDSAGTGDWHLGESIDPRARQILSEYDADYEHTARQVTTRDCECYDYLLVMDAANERALRALCPVSLHDKIYRVMEPIDNSEVPDPYYGAGMQGFEQVYRMLNQSLQRWLERWLEDTNT